MTAVLDPEAPGHDPDIDVDVVAGVDVELEMAEACGHLHAAQARLVRAVATMLQTGAWQVSGIRSPEHWLCWQAGVSQANAGRLVKVAQRWHELPDTMAAFTAGELSLDQVVTIAERAPDWADTRSAELARSATVAQLRTAMRGYPIEPAPGEPGPEAEPLGEPTSPQDQHGQVDPHTAEGIDDPDVDHTDPEHFSLIQTSSGSWRLTGRLDADHGLELEAALREIGDRGFDTTGRRPSRAACLIELARGHVDSLSVDRRHRYRVQFHIDTDRRVTDPHGYPLPHWLGELITCDPDISLLWERHGQPIARSSTSSTIDPDIRRHVTRRDAGRCRVPGCPHPAVHLHHIRHREHHGTNDPDNLVGLCAHHHRAHHRGLLTVAGRPDLPPGHPDGLTFADARGQPIRTNGFVRPPIRPAPPPLGHYRHPTGETLQVWALDHLPPPGHPQRPTLSD
jgi:hypothetical protein